VQRRVGLRGATWRPEPVWTDAGVGIPEVIAGEVDLLPADWRKVGHLPPQGLN
jgi:hypothetical protein